MENQNKQEILKAIGEVEHPAISATLVNLGMVKDITVNQNGLVTLSLVLPFETVPENITNFIKASLTQAVASLNGKLVNVNKAVMNEEELQNFLTIETQNWRG